MSPSPTSHTYMNVHVYVCASAYVAISDLTFTCKPPYEQQCRCRTYTVSGFSDDVLNGQWSLILPGPDHSQQRGRAHLAQVWRRAPRLPCVHACVHAYAHICMRTYSRRWMDGTTSTGHTSTNGGSLMRHHPTVQTATLPSQTWRRRASSVPQSRR